MDRFQLEDKIHGVSNVIEDLKTIASQVISGNISQEDTFDAIHGLIALQTCRHNELWDVFLQTFRLDEYADVEPFEVDYSEDTNPSIDLDFNKCNKNNCCKRNA